MSVITVNGINPTLPILGNTQRLIFGSTINLATFGLDNAFSPTSFIPAQTNYEIRNNGLSGYRWIHSTSPDDTFGDLTLQAFIIAYPTGENILSVNQSSGNMSFYLPTIFTDVITMENGLSMSSTNIINLANPVNVQDAATKHYVDTSISAIPTSITLTGNVTGSGSAGSPISTTVAVCPPSAITGYPSNTTSFLRGDGTWTNSLTNGLSISGSSLNMNSQKVTNLATPTTSNDGVNKSYADGIPGSFNITLSGAVSGSGVANTTISTLFSSTTTMQGATQKFDFGSSRNQTAFYLKNNYSGDVSVNPYDNRIGLTLSSPLGPGFAFSHTYSGSSGPAGEFHLLPLYSSVDGPYIFNVVCDGSGLNPLFELNTNVRIGTNTQSVTANARLEVTSTKAYNTLLNGTQTTQVSNNQICDYINPTLAPSAQVSGYVAASAILPTITVPNVTNPAIAAGYGQYINLTVNGTAGKTLTNSYGTYVGAGSLSTASVTNAYGGYFSNPGFGTNKIALYADNLSVGSSSTVPPANGLSVSGISWFGNTMFMQSNLISLKSASDLNNGIIYNSGLDFCEFRGNTGFIWKTGTAGATEEMRLEANGVLTLTGNASSPPVNASLRLKRFDTTSYSQVMFFTGPTNYMSLGFRSGGTNSLFIYDEINTLNVASFAPGSTPVSTFMGNVALGNIGSFGGGLNVVFVANAATVPSSNPTGGGVLFAQSGALKYKGSSGTITTIANA